jgi:putative PIN family toxin of toxin-antitoxin system
MNPPVQAVFDCNVLLQALARPNRPAGRCLDAVLSGTVDLHPSQRVLDELAPVAARPRIIAKMKLTPARTEKFLRVLRIYANYADTPAQAFHGCRDPDDDHYVSIALALKSPLIVSRDGDLLALAADPASGAQSLRTGHPTLRIMTPPEFLALLDELRGTRT